MVSQVLGCTLLWGFFVSNLCPIPTSQRWALGFGMPGRYSGCWVSQGSPGNASWGMRPAPPQPHQETCGKLGGSSSQQ